MAPNNKRIERSRTKPVRIYLRDWIIVDEKAGEDRPIKEGFREIIQEWKEDRDIEVIESLEDLGGSNGKGESG